MGTVLQRSGFLTEVASDGGEAIEMLKRRDYSAILLDVMMREVSGYDVVAFLSQSERRVPVVVCSAAGSSALEGFDPEVVSAVIRKPFDIDELVGAVAKAVGEPGRGS